MAEAWRRLTERAAQYHGVVALNTLKDLNVAAANVDRWVRSGHLRHVAPEVYVVAGSPLSWRQEVAIATGSTNGWASHRTAAGLWRLDGIDSKHVEVLTPFHQRRRRQNWIVHESRRISGVDLTELDGLPVTSVARTILDLPAVVPHPAAIAKALDDACRRWPGMLDIITQRHVELARRGRPGVKLMKQMLDERHGRGVFVQSGFEAATVKLVRSVGLPPPVLQHRVRSAGFRADLDLSWPDILWGIECDSLAWHSGKRAHEWDRQRRRKLKELGWDLVEVTYDDVTKRPRQVGEQLRGLFHQRRSSVVRGLQ